ncbi:hypothetical protein KY333_05115 [Candidatus Woesearchaeota archaeon]|nr:hypothetical protein [Candidatus Woesearchaeota archaeon]
MDKELENGKEEMINEEALSKAIDNLIEEHFGEKEDKEEISKASEQPEVKMDEIPKETDLKANGGKDYIKAESSDEEEKEEDEEEEEKAKKEKDSMKKEKMEYAKKSEESSENESEALKKSFEDFEKSINAKFDDIGEIFKGLKYEIDQLKKSPLPRQSIKNVEEIKKSFQNEESKEAFTKSEVEEAIDSLVKGGQISSSVGTEWEMFKKISNANASKMIASEILKNRKK